MLNKTKIELRKEEYYCKICLDKILEFIHQYKYETDTENEFVEGFKVEHFTLLQFQKWIGRGIKVKKPRK